MAAAPEPLQFSKDFPLDGSIFTTAKVSVSGSTDSNVVEAILQGQGFPQGDITIGHIAFSADTGKVNMNPAQVGGASVSFDLSGSAQAGAGVYGKGADAVSALKLPNSPKLSLPADDAAMRYLLMDFGFSVSGSVSGTIPVGALGSATFGVNATGDSTYAILYRFEDATTKAFTAIRDTVLSWRFPRHVAYNGNDLNIRPGTWVLAEADGSLALQLGASLGWNFNYAKDAKLAGVTQNLSVKIDASLKATLGFNVSGSYLVVAGRPDNSMNVRLQLFRQSSKGLNFGLNLSVGVQGADPQLPDNFNDFIQTVFGQHGLQVLNDLTTWTDPSTDLGQKLAGLGTQDAIKLLQSTVPGADVVNAFDKAKQALGTALQQWNALPQKLSSMVWTFLEKNTDPNAVAAFKTVLGDLASPTTAENALNSILQKATFGDTAAGQFLDSIADQGLLALSNDLSTVTKWAGQVENILSGQVIASLQSYISNALDLTQISNPAAVLANVDSWLQTRLGNFLDKTLQLSDLQDLQTAIQTLDKNVASYYTKAKDALTKHYSIQFASTYQKTTTDDALIDVTFNMSDPHASALYNAVVVQSKLDTLLTQDTSGVTLNQASLSHEISRKGTVQFDMPFFDFSKTHVNDAVASLQVENQAGRMLMYQANGKDSVTVANRAASQLSVLASLSAAANGKPQLASGGSIAYELRQVKAAMRPVDLEADTTTFISQYLGGLFGGGDQSLRTFYTDLDNALTKATGSQSNFLGDVAVSMQLSLPATVLAGWFQPRPGNQLSSDQAQLSRALQKAWRRLLPVLYFQDLNQYALSETVAALLVWSCLPLSTQIGIDPVHTVPLQFDQPGDVYWDWANVNLRRAMASDPNTAFFLGNRLTAIHNQLVEAGSKQAGNFVPATAGNLVSLTLNSTGDQLFTGLLKTESALVHSAAAALQQASGFLSTAKTAPSQAIKSLAQFAADFTEAFNDNLQTAYKGIESTVLGPMLLLESSIALGSTGTLPKALLNLYALKPGHTADLTAFVTGTTPPQADVALTQTLVSLAN